MGRIILTLFLINQMRALFFTAAATSLMMQDSTATRLGNDVAVLSQTDALKQQHDASMIHYFLSQLGLEEEKKEEEKGKDGKKKEEEGKKKEEEGKKKEEENKKKAEEGKDGKKKEEEGKKKEEEGKKKEEEGKK